LKLVNQIFMKNSKIGIFLILVLVALSGCSNSSDLEANVFSAYGVSDAENLNVLDVRTSEEFKSGCIDGAENIDINSPDFSEKIKNLDKEADYLVYCRSGRRSSQAVEIMKNAGFENVVDLGGGILNWKEQGNDVTMNCG